MYILIMETPKGDIIERSFEDKRDLLRFSVGTPNRIKTIAEVDAEGIHSLEFAIDNGKVTLQKAVVPEVYAAEPPEPYDCLESYREAIQRTMNKDLTHENALAMLAMGLSGEVGELVDMLKKHVFHGHELDELETHKELGDIYWYLHNLMNQLNISHHKVMDLNVQKLMKRYPDGFSEAASQRRVDTHENKLKPLGKSLETEKYFLDAGHEYAKHKALHANKPS